MSIQNCKDSLVVDHENVGEVVIPSLKKRVPSLKLARTALLEDEFKSIIFLSLLEEANDVETFVSGVKNHPNLSQIPIYCEYGLFLALPKDLNLIGFEESEISVDNQELENDENLELESFDIGDIEIKEEPEGNSEEIENLKRISAKALVLLESEMSLNLVPKESIFDQYLTLLKKEFSSL